MIDLLDWDLEGIMRFWLLGAWFCGNLKIEEECMQLNFLSVHACFWSIF